MVTGKWGQVPFFRARSGVTAAALVLTIPGLAFAAPENFRDLVALFVLIINVTTPALVALALVLFLAQGIATTFGAGGDKDKGFASARFRKFALWGVGILFVMVSIWGILRLIENTFLGSDAGALDSGIDEFCEGLDEC